MENSVDSDQMALSGALDLQFLFFLQISAGQGLTNVIQNLSVAAFINKEDLNQLA